MGGVGGGERKDVELVEAFNPSTVAHSRLGKRRGEGRPRAAAGERELWVVANLRRGEWDRWRVRMGVGGGGGDGVQSQAVDVMGRRKKSGGGKGEGEGEGEGQGRGRGGEGRENEMGER